MKLKYLCLTICLSLVCINPLFAKQLPSDASPVKVLKAALHLTPEQVADLKGLLEVRAAAVGAETDQIQALKVQLEEILQGENPDPLAVGNNLLETRMLKEKVGEHQKAFQVAFGELLTPEQKKQVRQIEKTALANQAAKALGQLKIR